MGQKFNFLAMALQKNLSVRKLFTIFLALIWACPKNFSFLARSDFLGYLSNYVPQGLKTYFYGIRLKNRLFDPLNEFSGKVMFHKIVPHKISRRNDPSWSKFGFKKKSYDHFLVILCEFPGFLTKNRLFDPLQGVLNIECALNWIYLVKLTHGKVFKSHLESKFDP